MSVLFHAIESVLAVVCLMLFYCGSCRLLYTPFSWIVSGLDVVSSVSLCGVLLLVAWAWLGVVARDRIVCQGGGQVGIPGLGGGRRPPSFGGMLGSLEGK